MSSGSPGSPAHPPLGRGGRRAIALYFMLVLVVCLVAISLAVNRRRVVASVARHLGILQRQPAVLETARVLDQNDDVSSLIAEALLDEEEGTPTAEVGASAAGARGLLLKAVVGRPAAAHYRFLLGRSVSAGSVESGLWERPLELAIRAAPGLDMAPEQLAARYLVRWPTLGSDQRSKAAAALKRAFLDPAFVSREFSSAADALGPETTVSLLPDDPEVLNIALRLSAAKGGGPHDEVLRARLKSALGAVEAPGASDPGS